MQARLHVFFNGARFCFYLNSNGSFVAPSVTRYGNLLIEVIDIYKLDCR